MRTYRTVEALARRVKADSELAKQLSDDPHGMLVELAGPPPNDAWIYRVVVIALGLVSVLALIGLFVMAFIGRTAPEGAVALGSAAIGALAGLLAPSPQQRE
jgi:hypothetical protein